MRTPVTFKIKDFFKSFRAKSNFKISPQDHSLILYTAGEVISECLIEDGSFKIGARGGRFIIRMVRPKGDQMATINYKMTNQLGRKVLNFNDHSNGLIARIFWDRDTCIFRDKHMWMFKPVRSLKRALAPVILNRIREYPMYYNKGDA